MEVVETIRHTLDAADHQISLDRMQAATGGMILLDDFLAVLCAVDRLRREHAFEHAAQRGDRQGSV